MAWICDESGAVLHANGAWAAYTGSPLGSCLRAGWTAMIPPSEREPVLEVWRSAFLRRRSTETMIGLVDAKGERRSFACRIEPLMGSGGRASWAAMLVEIPGGSEPERQERSRAVRDLARGAVWWKDAQDTTLAVNDTLCGILGRSVEEIGGKKYYDFAHRDDARGARARADRRRAKVAGDKETDVRLQAADGRTVWVHSLALPFWTVDGEYDGGLAMLREIDGDDVEPRRRSVPSRLLELQELTLGRVARELHDGLGQLLSAARIKLDMLRERTLDDSSKLLEEGIGNVDEAIQHIRTLALELRPSMLDDLGLDAGLRWYLDRQSLRAGIPIHTSIRLDRRLDPDVETACYRIVQEATANALRHASPQHLWLTVAEIGGALDLVFRDDGSGFEVEDARQRALHGASIGILGMQERARLVGGRLDIDSTPGQGTEIRLHIPSAPKDQ
jgi:PAS domain S-box-containing protein